MLTESIGIAGGHLWQARDLSRRIQLASAVENKGPSVRGHGAATCTHAQPMRTKATSISSAARQGSISRRSAHLRNGPARTASISRMNSGLSDVRTRTWPLRMCPSGTRTEHCERAEARSGQSVGERRGLGEVGAGAGLQVGCGQGNVAAHHGESTAAPHQRSAEGTKSSPPRQ